MTAPSTTTGTPGSLARKAVPDPVTDPVNPVTDPAAAVSRRRWTIGPVFVLRHAGLPFDWLEELTAPDRLLALAEAVLDAEDDLHSVAAGVTGGARLVAEAARGMDPDRLPARPDPDWERARTRWQQAVAAYLDGYPEAEEAAGRALRDVLSREPVQEAVFWSNPDVYANMLRPYLDRPRPLNARWRRVRRQLYTYVQRLCAKNETVSFFGPMGYGRVVDALPGQDEVRLRTDLPTRRRVFLAYWAAREIAAAVAADPRLRTLLPFRRTGLPGPDPAGRSADEAAAIAAVLQVLDAAGSRGADLPTIAAALNLGARHAALLLQPLVARGCLEFGLLPDPYDLDPLDALTDRLEDLPGPEAAAWAERIRGLRDLLGALELTPFPDRIAAVERVEAAFAELTGRPARRGSGAVYADRAVFYEECSSPFELLVVADVARRWAARITTALELSTAHGAVAQERAVREVVDQLGPGVRLSLPAYGERLREAFDRGGTRFDAAHAPAYPAGQRRERIGELLDRARHTVGDRYVLVDLCPAGADAEGLAVADAEGLAGADLVLSRCHHHLLTDGWLATMDTGGDFGADAAAWVAEHRGLVGVDVGRRNKGFYRFPGRRVAMRSPSAADAADPDLVWPQELTVRTGAGPGAASRQSRLGLTDPDGRDVALYLPLSDYVKYPPYAALSHPQVLHAVFDAQGSCPAVEVGGVVYQRPRWVVDAAQLSHPLPAARFLQLRRLARRVTADHPAAAAGGVRFVFCRTESERKPYLVDLACVLAADLAVHLAASGGQVIAEQMLPGPDRLWLKDSAGRRYTSELRMHVIGREDG